MRKLAPSTPYYLSGVYSFITAVTGYKSLFVDATIRDFLAVSGNEFLENMSALDFGCGTGPFTRALLEKAPAADVVGMSPPDGLARVYRRRFKRDPRVSFLGEAFETHLPFADERFDVIGAIGVFDHIKVTKGVLDEFSRVMKRQGLIGLTYDVDRTIKDVYETVTAGSLNYRPTVPIVRYNPKHLRELVESTGEFNVLSNRSFKYLGSEYGTVIAQRVNALD